MFVTDPTQAAQTIAEGYRFDSTALELGTVSVDGHVDPTAKVRIPLAMMNRHGLVAGATGTGKTKTLQLIAEQLSANGVPVVMADIKGDLSGLSRPGASNDKITARASQTGDDWASTAYPVEFVSLGGDGIGVPVRATMSAFGPILLSKVLGLNETQESTLGLIFHWADKNGLPLLDLKDIRSVIAYLTSDEGKPELKAIGGVSTQTAGVILRALTNLEAAGSDTFFGEPEIEPADLSRVSPDGKGIITLFELAGAQATNPVLFSTFLVWILADLFEHLPEVGDIDKPKLVFIFDESHLLFDGASKTFVDQVVQTVKLIRSKGVGVFFCSQLPTDIPDEVLSQLGARIQHALRAFTPNDQKALTKTVKTYPVSDVYKLDQALTSLGTGEAIVTVLSEKGAPTPVAWTVVRAPRSSMEAVAAADITAAAKASELFAKYGTPVDNESAYEKLAAKMLSPGESPDAPPPTPAPAPEPKPAPAPVPEEPGMITEILTSKPMQSFLRNAASQAGREFSRAIFGTGRRRR